VVRYWRVHELFQAGAVSGLNAAVLSEFASIYYLIMQNGKTAIEDKANAKSARGTSPDLAEVSCSVSAKKFSVGCFCRWCPARAG
jgi:hypothetical protein